MASPKIIPKKSTIADKTPLPEQLVSGEVSVNWADQAWHGKHPGTGGVVPIGAPYLHSHDQLLSLDKSRDLELTNFGAVTISDGSITTTLAPSSTANRTLTFPDKTGTLATVDDITAGQQADWNSTSGSSQILNKPTLATVATSGSYTDLTNKPTLGTAAATDATAYATAAQGAKADSASQPGHTHTTSDITGFAAAAAAAAPVQSVAGRTGAVTLTLSDIGQSSATSGQVATWSGSAWVPQTPSAGSGTVTSDTTGMTGATSLANIVQITQAGYNALTPVSTTLYIIVG